MLNFIICDDKVEFLKKQKTLIDNFMMNYDIYYKCYLFKEYDDKFIELTKKEIGFKVYLLDIETPCGSGIDTARYIREELNDWSSIISLITAHPQYKYEALSTRLMLLDFINKLNNCESNIKDILKIVISQYSSRHKSLNFEYNHMIHRIEYRHIIYIQKEMDSKRCLIKTSYNDEIINKTLNDVYKMLDDRFIKTSRSMIINVDQIEYYDYKENKILFKNGETSYDISRNMKKELKEYVRTNR